MGKTIMVSSHILPELADICNKIGIIERGEMMFNDTVAEVMKRVRPQTVLNIGVAGDRDAAAKLLRGPCARRARRRRREASHRHARRRPSRLQRPGHAAGRRRPQADAVPRGRAEPGDGVHGADEGDHFVSGARRQERGRAGDTLIRVTSCLPLSHSPCLISACRRLPRFTIRRLPSTISFLEHAPIV